MGFTLLRSYQREFVKEYWKALVNTPQIFRHIAFRRRTLEEELQEALLRGSLHKAFNRFDLLCLGLGIIIGSGWMQLTGTAAQLYAGAAVIVSYLFAGLATLLTAACFAELCLEYPVSGGAFSYIMSTFGEFPAFVALAGLLLEYALGMAAVARGFSSNLAALINVQPKNLRLWVDKSMDGHSFDLVAAGVVLLISVGLSLGVRHSALIISTTTAIKLALLLVVAIVGYTQGGWEADPPGSIPYSHWAPFTNPAWDVDGIFLGASFVFFSFTGFDAIGNAAEEAQNVRHLPGAILSAVVVATTVYFMLAVSLVVMAWPNVACPDCSQLATYSKAPLINFISLFVCGHGLKCMQYVTSLAALFGIITALTVGLFSASRIVMAASRDWLLPPFLAHVSRRTQTPLMAQMVLGLIIALLAMMVEVDAATSMVSFGTLVVLWLVCNAQMYRRYFPDTQMRFTSYGTVEIAPKQELESRALGRRLSLRARRMLVYGHLLLLNAICLGLTVSYAITTSEPPSMDDACPSTPSAGAPSVCGKPPDVVPGVEPAWLQACSANARNLRHRAWWLLFVLAWALVTLSLQVWCPLEYQPAGWHVPWWLMPWLPSLAIGLVCFSVGALPTHDYWKTAAFFLLLLAFYLLFSLPMSYIKHSRIDYVNTGDLNVVELTMTDGRWQPAALHLHITPATSQHSSAGTKVDMGMSGVLGAGSRPGSGPGSGPIAGKHSSNSGGLHPGSSTAAGSRPGSVMAATAAVMGGRPGSFGAAAGVGGRPTSPRRAAAGPGARPAGRGSSRPTGGGRSAAPGSPPARPSSQLRLAERTRASLPPTREGDETRPK